MGGAGAPPVVDQSSWEGVWETSWGEMRLVFDDGQFHGTYGSSQHALSGVFDPAQPGVLTGKWSHFGSTSSGGIKFKMEKRDAFGGGWSWETPPWRVSCQTPMAKQTTTPPLVRGVYNIVLS